MHHRHKVDAPSGTGAGARRGGGRRARRHPRRGGGAGARRPDRRSGRRARSASPPLRGGDVVGDHTVIFAGDGERLELTHRPSSRAVFAKGAVRAALWCDGRPAGLYSMRSWLRHRRTRRPGRHRHGQRQAGAEHAKGAGRRRRRRHQSRAALRHGLFRLLPGCAEIRRRQGEGEDFRRRRTSPPRSASARATTAPASASRWN